MCASAPASSISKPPRPLLDQQKFAEAVVILKEGAARLPKSAQLELALGRRLLRAAAIRRCGGRVSAHHRNRARDGTAVHFPRQDSGSDSEPAAAGDAAIRGIRSGASHQCRGVSAPRQGSGCAGDRAGDGAAPAREIDRDPSRRRVGAFRKGDGARSVATLRGSGCGVRTRRWNLLRRMRQHTTGWHAITTASASTTPPRPNARNTHNW